jgi:YD repeat-containing protein
MRLGNGLWEHSGFNLRLQTVELGLGTSASDSSRLWFRYDYGTTNNNGNVLSHRISAPAGVDITQSYTYDALNRLLRVDEPTWYQVYAYDRYGNRAQTEGYNRLGTASYPWSLSEYDVTTNRWNRTHDAAGNLTDYGQATARYDAENRLVGVDSTVYANQTFTYDGEGRRVKWTQEWMTQGVFVYNAFDQLVASYYEGGSNLTSYATARTTWVRYG